MRILILIIWMIAGSALADDRLVRLYADPALIESGLIRHITPRFSLKTQVRVEIVEDAGAADLVLDRSGRPLFDGLGQTWALEVRAETGGADRFADWLMSDVGSNTIRSFAPEGNALFSEPSGRVVEAPVLEYSGDAELGREVSHVKCGRCHVTEKGRGQFSIGSTPSFAVMRTFEDWEGRFWAFYALKPHPAFTQVIDVTPPFPPDRPSPMSPIELSLDEVEAIVAYVAAIEAADLGAPLDHQ